MYTILRWFGTALLLFSIVWPTSGQEPTPWHDPSPHATQFIAVDENVKLEVLDWGGTGRSLVLLAGLGNTAHVFDDFAPKLTGQYHVYGITRRGFGASSAPTPTSANYSGDRLGDDVLAVVETLKLNHPVLAGHSIAGEEMSSIASRHPDKVAGLVYIDAGYSYAYYDNSRGDFLVDLHELKNRLDQLHPANLSQNTKMLQELLHENLPGFENDIKKLQTDLQVPQPDGPAYPSEADLASFSAYRRWQSHALGLTLPESEMRQQSEIRPDGGVGRSRDFQGAYQAVLENEQKYTDIRVPVLAFFVIPHDEGPFAYKDAAARKAAEANDETYCEAQAKAFQNGVPSARVVRLSHVNHYVFLTNEADVLREMRSFLAGLQ